jgi:hypothetical protein
VPGGLSGVVAIAAGRDHSLALKSDGTVVAWGNNTSGQSTVPGGLNGVLAIAAGFDHSLALKSDGTTVAWGQIDIGFGNFVTATVPGGLNGVVAIAAGGSHSLALKSDGTVVAWGAGQPGQNGDPNYGQSTVPGGLKGVVAIAAGSYHSLALKPDGTVAAWGNNSSGQSTVPGGLNGVLAIAGGFNHSLAVIAETNQQPFTLGAPQWIPEGSLRWTLLGEAGRNYTVESSTNLTLWTDLQTVHLVGSSFQITDTNASAYPRRFYRARAQ